MAWINSAIQALDAKIAKAAAAASVTYVNAYGALANHELCSSVPYLHDVVLAHRQIESFHPTIGGQKILAALIEKALKLS
jgi:lysophospholipase L1-like esterase